MLAAKFLGHICVLERKPEVTVGIGKCYRRRDADKAANQTAAVVETSAH